MKTSIALLVPTGLLFAWSAPWSCQTYTLPDGGSSTTNPYMDGGNGGRFTTDAGALAVYTADAGFISIAPGDGGGVTVGVSANFTTDFVYASNYADGTVSRVLIQDAAGLPPYEQARYVGVVPEDNHCTPDNYTPSRICTKVSYPWQNSGCGDQLQVSGQTQGPGGYGGTSPSRTVVDRKGNVVVALRASCGQAGATRIINVGDHLNTCHVRCANRNGLAANQPFTEGVPLTTASGGTVILLPSNPPYSIPGSVVLPEAVIAAGTSAATTYSCPGHNPNDETDPVNYDDCVDFSVALGPPNWDTNADPAGLTYAGGQSGYGRAAAISPNCNPANAECDTWIGMYNANTWVHLSNGSNPPLKLFDVVAVDDLGPGGHPYGGAVDCAGVIWSQSFGEITGTTTVPLAVPGGLPDGGTASIPADTVIAAIPNVSACAGYGITTDINERVWIGSWTGGDYFCMFNAGSLVNDLPIALDAGWGAPQLATDVANGWQNYAIPPMGGPGRGVASDLNNNIYQGFTVGGASAASMNPDPPTGAFTALPCTRSGTGGSCIDKLGNPIAAGALNWESTVPAGAYGSGTIGVDLDDETNLWLGQGGDDSTGHATAVRMNGLTGAPMASVDVGVGGLYSYSDFTGYGLRHITLSSASYNQTFYGCGVSPEFTVWTGLGFTDDIPAGTDISYTVTVTNANDPITLANAQPYVVCASVVAGCGQGVPSAGGTIVLPSTLPQGKYMTVYATLVPKVCSLGGGGVAKAVPTLYSLNTVQECAGD